MKIVNLLLVAWLSNYLTLSAQSLEIYRIPAGAVATQLIPLQDQYRYRTFEEGNITYRNGTMPGIKLNYSFLYGEMQFVDAKGDTLALANEANIKQIAIGEDLFYYLPGTGFVELIADLPVAGLVRKQVLQVVDLADLYKNTGYHSSPGTYSGGISSPGGDTYVGDAPSFRQLFTRKATQDYKITRKVTFFMMDQNKRFYPVKRTTIVRLFPTYKKAIDEYLNGHQTDFRKEADLIQLLTFCNQLGRKGN